MSSGRFFNNQARSSSGSSGKGGTRRDSRARASSAYGSGRRSLLEIASEPMHMDTLVNLAEESLLDFTFDHFDTYKVVNRAVCDDSGTTTADRANQNQLESKNGNGGGGGLLLSPNNGVAMQTLTFKETNFDVQEIMDELTVAILETREKRDERAAQIAAQKQTSERRQSRFGSSSDAKANNPFAAANPFALSSEQPEKSLQQQQQQQQQKKNKPQQKNSGEAPAFDPELFRQAIEGSIQHLLAMREDTDDQLETLQQEAAEADRLHKRNLNRLNSQLSSIFSKFRGLDKSISTVSHTAVRIGSTLENVDVLKHLDEKGRLLLRHLLMFNKGPAHIPAIYPTKYRQTEDEVKDSPVDSDAENNNDNNNNNNNNGHEQLTADDEAWLKLLDEQQIDAMLAHDDRTAAYNRQQHGLDTAQQSTEGKLSSTHVSERLTRLSKAARLIQQLYMICEDVQLSKLNTGRDLIMKVSEDLEEQFLEQFDRATKHKKLEVMKQCALTLLNFPGRRVIQHYHHHFRYKLKPTWAPIKLVSTADRNNHSENYRRDIATLYSNIITVCTKETEVMLKVFPNVVEVFQIVLERLFEEAVQNFVDESCVLLPLPVQPQRQDGWSDEDYERERFMHAARLAKQMEKHLVCLQVTYSKSKDFVKALTALNNSLSVHNSSFGGNSAARGNGASSAAASNLISNDVIQSLFQQHRPGYVDKEVNRLRSLCYSEIQGRMVTTSFEFPALSKTNIIGRRSKETNEAILAYTDKVCRSDIVGSMLDSSGATVRRASAFLDEEDHAECVEKTFSLVYTRLMEDYFLVILNKIFLVLPNPSDVNLNLLNSDNDVPNPFVPFFLQRVVKPLNAQSRRIHAHYTTLILPRITTDSNIQTVWEGRMWGLRKQVQTKILEGLTRCLQYCVKTVVKCLKKQKSSYYKLTDVMELSDSNPVTESVLECVGQHVQVVRKSLEGRNLDSYMSALGLALYTVIRAHFQRHKVNNFGGMLVLQDAKAFHGLMESFGATEAIEKFSEFRICANVLLPSQDVVTSIKSMFFGDLKLNTMPIEEVHDVIKLRTDYTQLKTKLLSSIPPLQRKNSTMSGAMNAIKRRLD